MPNPQLNKSEIRPAAAIIAVLLLSLLPAGAQPSHAQATPATRAINGFDITGRFLQQWSNSGSDHDSYYVNGLPITPRRPEISLTDGKLYETQWFERARYELHPENQPPFDLQIGLLGSNLAEGRGAVDPANGQLRDTADAPFLPVPQPLQDTGSLWFPETRHTLSGKFRDTWNRFGGLQQFGFPISEPFTEQSATDGKPYIVQYFERNRFELHPSDPAPYDVQLGLLGSQQFRLQAIPAASLPIAPPPGITSARDTYTEGSLQEPDTMFCNEAQTVVALRFCSAVTFNDSLVGMDNTGEYFPLAAWYVPTIENGGSFFVGTGDDRHLITKYKLRPGIKWSDGAEITSNDAVFSYKLKLDDPLTATANRTLQQKLASVDNPDKYTIIYRWLSLNQSRSIMADPKTDRTAYAFLNPFIDLHRPVVDPAYIEIGTVHPQHVLQPIMSKLGADKIQESTEGTKPTGYGPYIVQEWKQGDQMTLIRNENYNLTAKPLIGKIVSKYNTDVSAQVNSFLAESPPAKYKIDGIARDGFTVPPEQTDLIREAGGIVSITPSTTWEHVDPKFTFVPFQDIRVRQAMLYGINRQLIIKVAYKGAGLIQNGPVPPGIYHSLDNPDFAKNFPNLAAKYQLRTYAYNPTLANQILEDAGWVKGADGIRAKGGVKLSFEYGTPRNATRQAVQALVAYDLKPLGIDAQVAFSNCNFYCPPNSVPLRCKLCEFGSVNSATSDFDAWQTDSYPSDPADYTGPNIQRYSNPKVDTANHLFKTSLDRATLAEQSAIIQTELMNDAAIIPLVQRANIEIYTSKLLNRKPPNSAVPAWWNIAQWYFAP